MEPRSRASRRGDRTSLVCGVSSGHANIEERTGSSISKQVRRPCTSFGTFGHLAGSWKQCSDVARLRLYRRQTSKQEDKTAPSASNRPASCTMPISRQRSAGRLDRIQLTFSGLGTRDFRCADECMYMQQRCNMHAQEAVVRLHLRRSPKSRSGGDSSIDDNVLTTMNGVFGYL